MKNFFILFFVVSNSYAQSNPIKYYNPFSFAKVYNINPNNLDAFVNAFYYDFYKNTDQFKNKDFVKIYINVFNSLNTEIYFKEINESQMKEDSNVLAVAWGMFDNCKVSIQVNPNTWQKADNVRRLWILYHELAHDVFNIEHGQGGPLMDSEIPPFIDEVKFLNAKDILVRYVSKNNLYPKCSTKFSELDSLLKN